MGGLFSELRRRNVFKVAVVYAIVAWLIAQVISVVHEPLHLPDWFPTAIIVLLIAGLPIAVLLAWAFELTPQGLKRTEAASGTAANAPAKPAPGAPPLPEAAADTRPSIAVLPFVDMSPDRDQEYFSDGIAEELLNQLAKVKGLHVAGRTSSFSFKGKDEDLRVIGQKLNVANVLEGSVRKAGDRVRVTAQLIKAADGYHLWSQSYDRDLEDIFAIQDEIAHAVTDALSITLGVGELGVSTRNVEAYEAFLEARAQWHRGGREAWLQAMKSLQRATALDSEFVEAWSWLAYTSFYAATVYIAERKSEFLERFELAAARAIAIAPQAPDALYVNALQESHRFNWPAAERLLEMAVERAPNNPLVLISLGSLLADVGRVREGLEYYRQASALDPLSMSNAQTLIVGLEFAGDLEGGAREVERAMRLEGDIAAVAGPSLALELTRGERARIDAAAELAIKHELLPTASRSLTEVMHAHLDEPEAAVRKLREFAQDPNFANPMAQHVMAFWGGYFGDAEFALKLFRPLLLSGDFIVRAVWRPMLRKMRQLPAFKGLLRDLRLVDYWRATGEWGDFVRPVGDDDFEIIG